MGAGGLQDGDRVLGHDGTVGRNGALGQAVGSYDARFHEQFSYLEVSALWPARPTPISPRTNCASWWRLRTLAASRPGRGTRPNTVRSLPLGALQRAQDRRRSFERGRSGARPTRGGRRLWRMRAVPCGCWTCSSPRRGKPPGPRRRRGRRARCGSRPSAAPRCTCCRRPAAAARAYPGIEPQVRIVRELGRGTAGEVADGRSDLAIATLDGAQLPAGTGRERTLRRELLPGASGRTPGSALAAAGRLGRELRLVHPRMVGAQDWIRGP